MKENLEIRDKLAVEVYSIANDLGIEVGGLGFLTSDELEREKRRFENYKLFKEIIKRGRVYNFKRGKELSDKRCSNPLSDDEYKEYRCLRYYDILSLYLGYLREGEFISTDDFRSLWTQMWFYDFCKKNNIKLVWRGGRCRVHGKQLSRFNKLVDNI